MEGRWGGGRLTVGHPAVLAVVTCSQVDLSWLETLTRAVHQSAADGLVKRRGGGVRNQSNAPTDRDALHHKHAKTKQGLEITGSDVS